MKRMTAKMMLREKIETLEMAILHQRTVIEEKDAEIERLKKFIEDNTHTLVNGWIISEGRK